MTWGWVEGFLSVSKAFRRLDSTEGTYLKDIQVRDQRWYSVCRLCDLGRDVCQVPLPPDRVTARSSAFERATSDNANRSSGFGASSAAVVIEDRVQWSTQVRLFFALSFRTTRRDAVARVSTCCIITSLVHTPENTCYFACQHKLRVLLGFLLLLSKH